jgi:ADP-ribosylglycohydrolase
LALCVDLALLLDGLERPGYPLSGSTGATSLHGRIATEVPEFLTTGEAPFATWHNGAYVFFSFPCALWCFLASPEDFEETLFTAVDVGHDADTVAAMACMLAGACRGYSLLPMRLVVDLEYHDHLLELADGLFELNRRLHGVA